MTRRRRTLAVAAALATVYVVWGSTYLGIALAIKTMPPLLMAGARFALAGGLLYAVARRVDRGRARPDRGQWAAALLTGLLLLGVGNGGVSWAEQTVPSGIAALVIATIPLWVVVLDRLVYGAALRPIAVLGVVVLVVAAAGWATGTLLSRGQRLTVAPLTAAAMQMLCGGGALLAAGVAAGELDDVDVRAISVRSSIALAYLVLFGSLLAFSAYVWALRNADTALVATYAYVNPVVAVALGAAFLDEGVSGRTITAGALVVGAVALIVSSGGRRAPAPRRSMPPAPAESEDRRRAAAALRGR